MSLIFDHLLASSYASDLAGFEPFVADHVPQFSKGSLLGEIGKSCWLPFQKTWLEWNLEQETRVGVALAYSSDLDEAKLALGSVSNGHDFKQLIVGRSFIRRAGQVSAIRVFPMWALDAEGKCLFVTTYVRQEHSDSISLEAQDCWANSVGPGVAYWLTLVNCKNIRAVDNQQASEKLNRKRKRNGNLPLVTYKTLEIDPTKGNTTRPPIGGSTSLSASIALHKVRGHLADYRKGNGLFGRHKGLFWIPAHERGAAENGVVIKTYEVKGS